MSVVPTVPLQMTCRWYNGLIQDKIYMLCFGNDAAFTYHIKFFLIVIVNVPMSI